MKPHTGIFMAAGRSAVCDVPRKQEASAGSSAEAGPAAAGGGLSEALWAKHFLEEQGYQLSSSTLYQGNQSAILLEKSGKAPSTKRARHLSTRFFFAAGTAEGPKPRASTEYMPAEEMIEDYFTKPLAGALLYKMRNLMLNIREAGKPLYKAECDQYTAAKSAGKTDVHKHAAKA